MHKPEYKKGDKILVEGEILTDRNESYTYLTSSWGNDNEGIYLADFDIFMKKAEVMLCLTEDEYTMIKQALKCTYHQFPYSIPMNESNPYRKLHNKLSDPKFVIRSK